VLFVCLFLYVDCVCLSFLYFFFFFVYAAIEIFSMNKVDYMLLMYRILHNNACCILCNIVVVDDMFRCVIYKTIYAVISVCVRELNMLFILYLYPTKRSLHLLLLGEAV